MDDNVNAGATLAKLDRRNVGLPLIAARGPDLREAPARIQWLMPLADHDGALPALQHIRHDVALGQDMSGNLHSITYAMIRFKATLKRIGSDATTASGARTP